MSGVEIGSGIQIGSGILISLDPLPIIIYDFVTEDDNYLISEDGNNFIEE
jgi:hypothetical protein